MREITILTIENKLYRTHDLLEIKSLKAIQNLSDAPNWVIESLTDCPFVVVRRQGQSSNNIAIGVRGHERNQRWAGFVSPNLIKSKISPLKLRTKLGGILSSRFATIPALLNLRKLENEWCRLQMEWGPGGSVGFELATGQLAAKPSSDLDIVLFAPDSFSIEHAQELVQTTNQISTAIDVLVETPYCGFSLTEFSNKYGQPLMLRYADQPRMGMDPWRANGAVKLNLETSSIAEAGS